MKYVDMNDVNDDTKLEKRKNDICNESLIESRSSDVSRDGGDDGNESGCSV